MDQNLKKNFDLNSATSGVGLAEASKQLTMTFGNMTHPRLPFQLHISRKKISMPTKSVTESLPKQCRLTKDWIKN